MSNCIQFTIGDKIYKFRDVDLKKSATLDDIISAIAEDPNYAGQLEDLNIDLNYPTLDVNWYSLKFLLIVSGNHYFL